MTDKEAMDKIQEALHEMKTDALASSRHPVILAELFAELGLEISRILKLTGREG